MPYKYELIAPIKDKPLESCVANPIDPTSGNKFQFEPLIQLSATKSINFDLIYNSQRQEKWRHNYSRSVISVSNAQRPGFSMNKLAFCSSNTLIIESSGGFGDAIEESIYVDNPYKLRPKEIVKMPK